MSKYLSPTKYRPEVSRGRDFLGQQFIVQLMADICLPSFTNATWVMRYYSFWAWAFSKASSLSHDHDDNIWVYLMKLETALILANRFRNPSMIGMPGIQGMKYSSEELRLMSSDDIIDLSTEDRATSYAPVQYSPSLGRLNIASREKQTCMLLKNGKKLADAFDVTINHFQGYHTLISPKKIIIRCRDLRQMAPALSLEAPSEKEQEIFESIIIGTKDHPVAQSDIYRVKTTQMLLELIDKTGGISFKEIKKEIWYSNILSHQCLHDIRDGWRLVEGRRIYQYAVETILASFCHYLNSMVHRRSGHFEEFCNCVFKCPFPKYTPFSSITNISFGDYLSAVYRHDTFKELNEWNLVDIIEDRVQTGLSIDDNRYFAVLDALHLLFKLIQSVGTIDTQDSPLAQRFIREPSGYRHSLIVIMELINSWSHLSLKTGLKNCIIELVLKLHLGVAQEKWYTTGNFTYRFIQSFDAGFELVQLKDSPVMTENKLGAYLFILRDIGLLEYDDPVFKITWAGKKYLSDYI